MSEIVTTNLTSNGSIDAPEFAWNWGGGAGRTVSKVPSFRRAKGNAMRVLPTALGSPAYLAEGSISRIPVIPGRTYRAAVWARYPDGIPADPRTIQFMISQLDSAGAALVNIFPGPVGSARDIGGPTTPKRLISDPYVPAAGVASISAYVHGNGDGTNEPYEIEDLVFMEWNGSAADLPDFNGDSPNAEWNGIPYQSTSTLYTDTVGDRLYEALEPVAAPYDPVRGYPLRAYARAVGGMFQPVENLVRDLDQLFDPDLIPISWIPWLGQFVGQPISLVGTNESDLSYRARNAALIKDPPHRRRGTVSSIVEEVQKFLTGNRTVYITERQGGNARQGALGVIVAEYAAGTTLAKIQARVNAIKPAGRIITVSEVSGLNWQALRDTHTDWTDVRSTFVDWNEVRTNPTKQ